VFNLDKKKERDRQIDRERERERERGVRAEICRYGSEKQWWFLKIMRMITHTISQINWSDKTNQN